MGFWRLFKKAKRYSETAANSKLNSVMDPKIQLEQAMSEFRAQSRDLQTQAANVLAGQKTAEMRLHRTMDSLSSVQNKAAQALRMADAEIDPTKKDQFNRAAESYAHQLMALEAEADTGKAQVLAATSAAEKAREAVRNNAADLQKQIANSHRMMSQLDQAKMQEAMNKTMQSLSAVADEDVPSLDQVQAKIEARYAKALGVQELATDDTTQAQMLVEHAAMDQSAQMRLSELRTQLGIGTADTNTPEPST